MPSRQEGQAAIFERPTAPEKGRMAEERQFKEEPLGDLMARYQEGDLTAFDQLYRSLRPRLLQYILGKVMNRSRAEDLLQETFLQLHKARRTFRPDSPVLPWAYGVARHVCLVDFRKRGRRERYEMESPEETLPEIPMPAEAETMADREAVRQALAMLPEDRRETLLLHHVAGLSFKEIAGVYGIREQAAKVRAHRAGKAFKEFFSRICGRTAGPSHAGGRERRSMS
jgi:RNA polymerase sigma-70 factor, ECF subfamily